MMWNKLLIFFNDKDFKVVCYYWNIFLIFMMYNTASLVVLSFNSFHFIFHNPNNNSYEINAHVINVTPYQAFKTYSEMFSLALVLTYLTS